MENNKKTINDLPLELLREILLRLPVKSLVLLKPVSKTWLSLISDPIFAESHFELAAAPTRRCLFIKGTTKAVSYDLDALFLRNGYPAVKLSLPSKKSLPVYAVESCRGFVLLDQHPNLIVWNPSTGAHKGISYSHIVSLANVKRFQPLRHTIIYGFGYDASKDDYLVALAWWDVNEQEHLDLFSVRNNSWKNVFEVAVPYPLLGNVMRRDGLFLNGAFHWLACSRLGDYLILVFDLKERSFSEINLSTRLPTSGFPHPRLIELEGCLALHFWINGVNLGNHKIWVMKEYKVLSSWKLYEISETFFPLGSASDGGIIGFDVTKRGCLKYNVSGHKLEHCGRQKFFYGRYTMYTESLMSLPNDSEAKKEVCHVGQEYFEELDASTNQNQNEIKET